MESKGITREDARAALESIDEIERQTQEHSPAAIWPSVLVGVLFACAVVVSLLESGWVFLVMALAVLITVAVLLRERRKPVRASYKQPVQDDDSSGANWWSYAFIFLMFPTMQLVPHGNLPVALAAGAVIGAVGGYATWREMPKQGRAQ